MIFKDIKKLNLWHDTTRLIIEGQNQRLNQQMRYIYELERRLEKLEPKDG
jgi:hypothetical protein